MEFEDSRNALFVEPNAYIQSFHNKEKSEIKKVVFQEPYDSLPNFYLDNNFKKGKCQCVSRHKQHKDCDCKKNQNDLCKPTHNSGKTSLFDIKSLLPLVTMFTGGKADLSSFVSLMNKSDTGASFNPMSLIANLVKNKEGLGAILNMFKGGAKTNKNTKKEIKSTDFEIKNYTRV